MKERDKLFDNLLTYKHGNFPVQFALDAVDQYCESLTAAKPDVSGMLAFLNSKLSRLKKDIDNTTEAQDQGWNLMEQQDIEYCMSLIREYEASCR